MLRSVLLILASVVGASTVSTLAAAPAGVQLFAGNWSRPLQQGNVTYMSTISAAPWGQWIKEDMPGKQRPA